MRIRGITLVEVLFVIAIIAVVASILLPPLSGGKRRAKVTTTISNLHQCQLALLVYAESEDARFMPPNVDAAWEYLGPKITRDPLDYWRKGEEKSPYRSMVGSFGYARADLCTDPEGVPKPCLESFGETFPLLVSIFANEERIPQGEYVEPQISTNSPFMPKQAVVVWANGRARLEQIRTMPRAGFTWGRLFLELVRGNH